MGIAKFLTDIGLLKKQAALTLEQRDNLEKQREHLKEQLEDGFITEQEYKAKIAAIDGQLKQAAVEPAPAPEAAPVTEVVDPVAQQLMDQKAALEQQKKDAETKIESIDQQMAQKDLSLNPQPQAPIKENASMETIKPAAEETKVEAPAAVTTPAPETPVKEAAKTVVAEAKPFEGKETPAEEKAEAKAEEKKEEAKKEAAFSIHFVKGDTFDKSFFVAEHNGDFRAVKASRIIPAEYQNKILHAIATTGKAPADVASPSDLIEQMTAQGVNDIPTFEAAVAELSTNASMRKTAGFFAMNESEIPAPAKAGEEPLNAVVKAEGEAGRKAIPVPSGSASPVHQYYGRLPSSSAGGNPPNQALNPQSMRDKVDFMRKALEQMKAEKDAAEEKAKGFEDKAKGLEKEKEDSNTNMMLESIVKDLLAKKLMDAKDEQAAISALAKIERKCLPQVASLLKLLGKAEKPGAEDMKPPMGPEKVIKSSVIVPRQFLNENEPDQLRGAEFLAKNW